MINTKKIASIISLSMAIIFLLPLISFAQYLPGDVVATPTTYDEWTFSDLPDSDSFWEILRDSGERTIHQFQYYILGQDVCPLSSETNGLHNFVKRHTEVDGQSGYYWVCEYCGKSAGEAMAAAEQNYVDSLPASSIDSTGGIIWQPVQSDVTGLTYYLVANLAYNGSNFTGTYQDSASFSGSLISVSRSNPFRRSSSNTPKYGLYSLGLIAPYSGYYSVLESPLMSGVVSGSSDETSYSSYSVDCSFPSFLVGQYNSGSEFSVRSSSSQNLTYSIDASDTSWIVSGVTCYLPTFSIVPSSGSYDVISSDSHDTYNTNTRTGSITGDYGIIGDNNIVTVYEDTTIVNEGDKILTIPGAGDGGGNLVIPFTGWSYDYNDRSYDLTFSNDEYTGAKVTFDDAKLQIDLSYTDSSTGDTVTNTYDIKYVIETTVQETPTPTETPVVTPTPTPVVTETPTPTTTVQPTTTPSTETDSDGTIHVVVENPYPVYPAEGLEVPEGWIELRDRLLGFFRELPEMFGQLTDFLRSAFDFIPSEIITLISFAIAMAVLVGLFKMFWR